MFSIRFNRWTIAAFAFTALAVPGPLAAQTPGHPADNSAQFPNSRDLKSLTMSGSYLAARHASVERDASSAATFYRSALRTDPKNNELLDRAFISSLADGDIDEAVKLADRILTMDKSNRVARLVLGVRDLKTKKYASAQQNINQSVRGPITDLVATLLSGWASYGAGETKTAIANIDKLAGPEWYPIFKDLHSGMILDLAHNHSLALLSLADLYESVKKPAMAIKVYERVPANSPLKRNAQIQLATDLDAADRSDEAIKILKGVTAEDPKDLEAIMALGNIERGRKKFADCTQTYTQGIDALPAPNDKGT